MPAPEYQILVVRSWVTARGRAGYVFSVAPGWRVTVVSDAPQPTPDDMQRIIDECFPRWRVRYPRQPGV